MAGLLSLKWNNHSTAFLQSIGKIHLKEKYCDATIVCQGQYFPVHRIVLSTCSLYFDEMFEMIKTQHPFIVFRDIDPREMSLLLNYMYKGEINVEQDLLPTLVKAAEALKIKGIAVPDDFPSVKTATDRKRNNPSDTNSNPKRRAEDWRKTSTSKLTSPNRISNCNSYSDVGNSFSSSEDSTGQNVAESKMEETKSATIKEEPIDVFDFDASAVASTYNTVSCESTKESLDMYSNLPEKTEASFITPADLSSSVEETDDSQLSRLNNFNDVSSVSNVSSHDEINEQSNDPAGSNPESMDIKSNTSLVAGISKLTADEARTEIGPSSSYEIELQNNFDSRRLFEEVRPAKPFRCQICGRYFALKQHLQNHMHIHTGIKNFACIKCSKRFALKQHLQIHLRVHTGEKPYICSFCPKRFRQKSHLNSHMACVHNM